MAKKLLLISDRVEDVEFARRVASISQLQMENKPLSDESALRSYLQKETADLLIFADASTEREAKGAEEMIQQTVGLFSEKVNPNFFHFISSEDISAVKSVIESPIFGHFLIRKYGNFDISAQHYGKLVLGTLNKECRFENIFRKNINVQTLKFKETGQKQQAVESVRTSLVNAKFKPRMATVIANAVDELLMNAMFDAPVDELGNPLFLRTSRAERISLNDQYAVEMKIGFDGEIMGICVVDLWGSMDKAKVLRHISRRYVEESYQVKTTEAGAGIGLATVFRSGGSLFFNCESRVRTEVSVFFRRTSSYREFKDQFRFISTQFVF